MTPCCLMCKVAKVGRISSSRYKFIEEALYFFVEYRLLCPTTCEDLPT